MANYERLLDTQELFFELEIGLMYSIWNSFLVKIYWVGYSNVGDTFDKPSPISVTNNDVALWVGLANHFEVTLDLFNNPFYR